jgi:hypothetical protein
MTETPQRRRLDISQSKEQTADNINEALLMAVRMSRGAAIVNVADLPFSQDEIASALSPQYYQMSVEKILTSTVRIPEESIGIVLTGYTRKLYENSDQENRVEAVVRSEHNMRLASRHNLNVLILSDSLPDENVFHNSFLPWFNGPFQGDDSVWSIQQSTTGVELTRYRRETKTPREAASWVPNRIVPFL